MSYPFDTDPDCAWLETYSLEDIWRMVPNTVSQRMIDQYFGYEAVRVDQQGLNDGRIRITPSDDDCGSDAYVDIDPELLFDLADWC